MHVDGDDELIGRNVLKIFNAAYQQHKAGAIYSNFFKYNQGFFVFQGFTSEYPEEIKKQNLYRHFDMDFSHLKTYRN